MIGLDMFNIANNVAQRVLSQSNNISYAARGASRMNSIPDDRQADYLFRDFYMILVTAYFTEVGFRLLETILTIPKFTEAIGFNRMQQLYGKEGGLHGYFPQARNYKNIPELIRPRVLGSLVDDKGNPLIAKLVRDMDLPKMQKQLAELQKKGGSAAKIVKLEARIAEAELLGHHFRRFFDFKGYVSENLVELGTVKPKEAVRVAELMEELSSKVDAQLNEVLEAHGRKVLNAGELKQLEGKIADKVRKELEKAAQQAAKKSGGTAAAVTDKAVAEKAGKGLIEALVERGTRVLKKAEVDELAKGVQTKVLKEHKMSAKVRELLSEGLSNGRTRTALKAIQKNSIWPKMAMSVVLGFVYFGIIANNFDTKVLQPWQEKLVKERGTSREVVPPFYKALLPGAATLGVLMSNKTTPFLRRLGYLGRFSLAGAAALVVYTGVALAGVKRALAKPPEQLPGVEGDPQLASASPNNPLAGSLQRRPMGFQMFEMARQAGGGTSPFTVMPQG